MRRFVLVALCGAAIGLTIGCTSSDREYMRNHVVQTSSKGAAVVLAERNAAAADAR